VLGNSGRLGPDFFKGKPVLIGLSAEGTTDIAATPLAGEEFGPLVQAQLVDTILRGGWLERPRWAEAAEWLAALLLALVALGAAMFGRVYRLGTAIIFVVLPVASWLAFANASLLLDPLRPVLVGGGAAAGVGIALFALARADRERLREALVEERVATAETQGELQAARAIQLAMVPPRARLRSIDPRVDLDALLEPAKSVGGDFFDAVMISDHQLGIAIGDVAGKGVPAALFMAMSKALTSAALSRRTIDPEKLAEAINLELIKDNREAMNVAMMIAILDLATGEASVISAGQEDPLVWSADKNALTRVRLDGGPPFGILDFPYPIERISLRAGETLVLITDGVTEAQNAKDELFGREKVLAGAGGKVETAAGICEYVRDQVRQFEGGAEPTDDLTIMAVRYLG
jgi:serine phosphatase RsbU (regulator of sigma subunit)